MKPIYFWPFEGLITPFTTGSGAHLAVFQLSNRPSNRPSNPIHQNINMNRISMDVHTWWVHESVFKTVYLIDQWSTIRFFVVVYSHVIRSKEVKREYGALRWCFVSMGYVLGVATPSNSDHQNCYILVGTPIYLYLPLACCEGGSHPRYLLNHKVTKNKSNLLGDFNSTHLKFVQLEHFLTRSGQT